VQSGEVAAASVAESDEFTAVSEGSLIRGILSEVNAMPDPVEPRLSPPIPPVAPASPEVQKKPADEPGAAEAEVPAGSPVRQSPQVMSEPVTTPLTMTTPALSPTPSASTVEPSPAVAPAQAVQQQCSWCPLLSSTHMPCLRDIP